jgi:hypothetical protein
MRRQAAAFAIALAFVALTFVAGVDARENGPFEIDRCQTISQPGSYRLANNLTLPNSTRVCLTITADFVTINLAGFTMTGQPALFGGVGTTAIEAGHGTTGITVRNGSISGIRSGVDLQGVNSVVEELHAVGAFSTFPPVVGIAATGIVRGNTVSEFNGGPGQGVGISATGIVTGNYAQHTGSRGSRSVRAVQ